MKVTREDNMTLRALLASSNYKVKTIGPKIRVETACALLDRNRIGALPVVDAEGALLGIVSERDVVRVIAARGTAGLLMPVDEVMTRQVITVTCDASVKEAMQMMDSRRIRHLPIMDGDRLVAIISVRDVIKYRLQETEMEKNVLRDFAVAQMH